MAGVALDTLNIAAAEHQFVGGAGVPDAEYIDEMGATAKKSGLQDNGPSGQISPQNKIEVFLLCI